MNNTTPNLDKYDKHILFRLDRNGRSSLGEIAKTIGRSKNFVAKRLQALRDARIVTGFSIIMDRSALGFESYRLYFRLVDEEQEVITFLRQQKLCLAVYSMVGKYQVYCALQVQSTQEIEDLILQVGKLFPKSITKYKLWQTHSYTVTSHNFLFEERRHTNTVKTVYASTRHTLLDKERKVLTLLSKNPLMSFTELGKNMKSTPATARKIVEGLCERNVILGILPIIQAQKLGYIEKQMMVKLRFTGMTRLEEMRTYLTSLSFAKSLTITLGEISLIGHFVFKDISEFKAFHMKLYKNFGDILYSVDYLDYFFRE